MPLKNRGFVLIAAIILIVVAASMAAVLATMVAGSAHSGGLHIGSAQALSAAEAGLERGLYERNRNAWDCITPASYAGTVGSGGTVASYSTTCIRYNPSPSTTLTGNITSSSTVIPVASLVNYAPYGRVKIGSEYIDYPSTSNTSCGAFSPPCLTNALRGAENTSAVLHNNGASITQDHYIVTAVGASDPAGTQRTLKSILTVAGNLLPTSANANFNSPSGPCDPASCSPTGWLLSSSGDSSGQRWDDTGGPDGSRSAIVIKPSNGPTAGTTAGQFTFTPAISITGPTTVTFTFDYRHEIGEPAGGTMGLAFTIRERAPGTNSWTSVEFLAGKAAGYRSGTTTLTITQTGTFFIDKLEFSLVAKAGQAKTIRLDNINLSAGGGGGTQVIRLWRENFP